MKVFRARHLLPIGAPPIEDGALLVDGERILAVGRWQELAAACSQAAAVVFEDAVILPPLVNAHTHLELTDFHSWAQAAGVPEATGDIVDWIMHLLQVRRTVGAEAVRTSLGNGLKQSLAAGTGAIGDILTTLPAWPGYGDSPMRGRVFVEVLGVDSTRVKSRLAELAAGLASPPGESLSWGLSPHAPYTLSRETLADVLDFAKVEDLPLAMHWAETLDEIDFLLQSRGPMVEKLYPLANWPIPASPPTPADFTRMPAGSLLIHGVHAEADAVAAIAAAGQTVVLCPRSNSRFGEARAPLSAYRRAGMPLALGTDSLASSPSLSVWEELAFARHWFAGQLAPAEWLTIATSGGAAALGLGGRIGCLAAGYEASFQVVMRPTGASAATLAEALCSGGKEVAVQSLYLGGKQVYASTT